MITYAKFDFGKLPHMGIPTIKKTLIEVCEEFYPKGQAYVVYKTYGREYRIGDSDSVKCDAVIKIRNGFSRIEGEAKTSLSVRVLQAFDKALKAKFPNN